MKSELDAIWQTSGVAWPSHLASWTIKDIRTFKYNNINTRFGQMFMSIRGRFVQLKMRKRNGRNS